MSSSHPIKLRVWDVERSIYLEDEVMWSVAGVPADMMPGQSPFIPFMMVALKSPATKYVVERFTGLLDKSGQEIYEGDMILHHNRYTKVDREQPYASVVKWRGDRFLLEAEDGSIHTLDGAVCAKTRVVYGNVHQGVDKPF